MTKTQVIDKVVEFFFDTFIQLDKWDTFETNLRQLLTEATTLVTLYTDYDPQDDLLKLINNSNLPCRGWSFSAAGRERPGIFTKIKFGVTFNPIHQNAHFKNGYGAPFTSLYWTEN